jgi:hypothetical protein
MREVDRDIVLAFIQQAHQGNIMAMAYNASYSRDDDVSTRSNNPPTLAATGNVPVTTGWRLRRGERA